MNKTIKNKLNIMYTFQPRKAVITLFACLTFSACLADEADHSMGNLEPQPPKVIYQLETGESSLTHLGNQTFRLYKSRLFSRTSKDGGYTWGELIQEKKDALGGAGVTLVDDKGRIHSIFPVRRELPLQRGQTRAIAENILRDLWYRHTLEDQSSWSKPKKIFEGYVGAVLDFKKLSNGRLILPFATWVAGRSSLPEGYHFSTVIYSDNGGLTWTLSQSELTSPTFEDYNGNNYGAIEPTILELDDKGTLLMLMRTQTGFLYQSFSYDYGTTWSVASPSRFYASTGPPLATELEDGRLILIWNNCEMPPRVDGEGVYGGRDAIHAAISSDKGKTWQGFREIHRDPLRNETPPRRGDRGTAYANSPHNLKGKLYLITGMGEGRRHIVGIDPDWLSANTQQTDFTNCGLESWHVFKHFGPAERWWRDRTVGPHLVNHPDLTGKKVLHIRRPDQKAPDGAVWNFPNAWEGKMTIRLRLNEGFEGGLISLTDRFFNPTDDHGERLSMFLVPIDPEGNLPGGIRLSPGIWHELQFTWNLSERKGQLLVNGQSAINLPLRNETLNGLSYLRLRSAANSIDTDGFLVESVKVEAINPIAPEVDQPMLITFVNNYRRNLSYFPADSILTNQHITTNATNRLYKQASTGHEILHHAEELPELPLGPFDRLPNGDIITVEEQHALISADQGKTWRKYPLFANPEKYELRPERALQVSPSGSVIVAFTNQKERANWNWNPTITDSPGAILPTYAMRSTDGGRTWEEPIRLHDEWTGAIRDMIVTKEGSILFTSMKMLHNPGRHASIIYRSEDDGKTWTGSDLLEMPAVGHHAGLLEGTFVQLRDERIWLLMRSAWGRFIEAFSEDDGRSWKALQASQIEAANAPAFLHRLESGRLVLLWNRPHPESMPDYPLRGGDNQWSDIPASNHREELSIAFSSDDGASWTRPQVLARVTPENYFKQRTSYPLVFEVEPGVLWITIWQSDGLRLRVMESEFIETAVDNFGEG